MDLLITNATVVNATGTVRAHVGIEDGVITSMLAPTTDTLPAADRTIAADGRLLIPGGVDAHCHVQQITGAYTSLDTFESASVAALHGGTTTIIDFGIPGDPSQSPRAALQHKLDLIRGARCDVALHGSVVRWDDTVPEQLEWMAEQGVPSVKLYTTNRGSTMADDDTILATMQVMARLGGLTYIHSEHDAIIVGCTSAHADDGRIGIRHLPHTRPTISEAASVREVLAMAAYAEAPVYFVHQSTPEAVDAVHEARARGQEVYNETCPHYLLLDDSVYESITPEKFACCPPMRTATQVAELNARVRRGHLDVVSSDHSCYDLSQKRQNDEDVRHMPHGLPGVETRMPAAFTALVQRQGMSVERFVDVFATAPATINGLGTKGVVGVGYDADLVIFDPSHSRTVQEAELHQGTDFSPFDGLELQGWPQIVVSAGRVVVEDGVFTDPGAVGRFRPRSGRREGSSGSPSPCR
jgi:dihydropyrimidinase